MLDNEYVIKEKTNHILLFDDVSQRTLWFSVCTEAAENQ